MNIASNNRPPIVTYTLIGLCVLIFFALDVTRLPQADWLALYIPENPNFQYWQYLTSLFMHGSLSHLLFNMLALWMFGVALERLWGSTRFLLFYLSCGIGAGLIYNVINTYQLGQLTQQLQSLGLTPEDLQRLVTRGEYRTNVAGLTKEMVGEYYLAYNVATVGASGAIYGILVAFAFCFPNTKLLFLFVPVPIAAKYFVPAIIGLDLLSGITGFSIFGDNVAHFAHVGGGLVGFILMLLFGRGGTRRLDAY
ncbi:rhomboid family intramembrane serine protease [uncultured Thiothrix sp.]|uniref:rhomboid family intramembrane serine protease n=1 Tax=uncultured Thiothrix sp. TaxID=223185 RepID=UPI00262B744B|nr:rhomboid family intramembrane serine protease [uncultured Thiothrix sp.]HMT94760.1 rhomboid family intramembrane serine protease [Thiolinea sp.]